MTAKPTKKRPKVRYIAFGNQVYFEKMMANGDRRLYVTLSESDGYWKADRIAIALNAYEARRRGELT